MCLIILDFLIKFRDFRVDFIRGNRLYEVYFIWEFIDLLDEMIRGKFRGYKVRLKYIFLFVVVKKRLIKSLE